MYLPYGTLQNFRNNMVICHIKLIRCGIICITSPANLALRIVRLHRRRDAIQQRHQLHQVGRPEGRASGRDAPECVGLRQVRHDRGNAGQGPVRSPVDNPVLAPMRAVADHLEGLAIVGGTDALYGLLAPSSPHGLQLTALAKGYENFIVQDLVIQPAAIRFRRERWVTPDGRTVVAPLPDGIDGHFGPELRRFVLAQYHQGQVTVARLVTLLDAIGIESRKKSATAPSA